MPVCSFFGFCSLWSCDDAVSAVYNAVASVCLLYIDDIFGVNENGFAKRIKVQIGERFNEMIEISAPEVKEGMEIVSVGQSRLVDGVKLNVIQNAEDLT